MFDLQVNGYAGVDFNSDTLTPENLHQACDALQRDGIIGILATLITDSLPKMQQRLHNFVQWREQDPLLQQVIAGIHLEGPFLSPLPGFIGAHAREHVIPANLDDVKRLVDAAGDLLQMITLAPEMDARFQSIKWLSQQGVCVAAGHCDPSLELLRAACDHGLKVFTHVGNGCPALLPRHDNIIQRALSLSDRLYLSFIADDAHIPLFVLKNMLQQVGLDRCIFITDAISAASLGPGTYQWGHNQVKINDDLVARSADGSFLVGSTLTRQRLFEISTSKLQLTPEQFHQVSFVNPLKVLGVEV